MLSTAVLLSLLPFFMAVHAATIPMSSVSSSNIATLNTTVGGRLHVDIPYGRPCYSSYASPLGPVTGSDPTECNAHITNAMDGTYRLGFPGSMMQMEWEGCIATGENCAYNPRDATDSSFWAPPAVCQQGNLPDYYIDVQSAADVASGLAFAQLYNVQLAVKGTGHDLAGRSATPGGLMLWTHSLQSITRNTNFYGDGCSSSGAGIDTVTFGAGVVWEQAYTYAEANSITIVGGGCGTVGSSGGFIMGGGMATLGNIYGMGADRVVQLKVVTPDGVTRTANKCQNKDLFFAMRGGGVGTYGVIIESTHKVEPQITPAVYFIGFSPALAPAGTVQSFFQVLIQNSITWSDQAWGGYVLVEGPSIAGVAYINPTMSVAAATTSLQPLITFFAGLPASCIILGVNSVTQFASYLPLWQNVILPLVGTGGGQGSAVAGRIIQERNFATPAAQTALLDAIMTIYNAQATSGLTGDSAPGLVFQIVGPRLWSQNNAVAAKAAGVIQLGALEFVNWPFTVADNLAAIKTKYQTATGQVDPLRALTPTTSTIEGGAYIGEGDTYEADWQAAFYGSHYNKLLHIKDVHDPLDVLRCWKCVGWTGASDDRYKCYPTL